MTKYKATIWTKNSSGGVQKIEDSTEAVNATDAQEILMRKWKVSRSDVGSVSQIQQSSSVSGSSGSSGSSGDIGFHTIVIFGICLLPVILLALWVFLTTRSYGWHDAVSWSIAIAIVAVSAAMIYASLIIRAIYIVIYGLGVGFVIWDSTDMGWAIFWSVPVFIVTIILLYSFVLEKWSD